MLRNIWEYSKRHEMIGGLRTNNFTIDHWEKNSYLRMRVYLAVQVMSDTMRRMIISHADHCGGTDKYKSILEIISNIDLLVDICNGTNMSSKGIYKGCECINTPDHPHIGELLDIMETFVTWKLESGEEKRHFITEQSYEDLIYLVVGIVGLASTYLKADRSRIMVQSRSSSNVVEHEFAGICQRNSKPTGKDVRQVVSRRSATRGSTFTAINNANTRGGDNDLFVVK